MRYEYKPKIVVCGSKANVEKTIACLDTLKLSGDEGLDRLVIQQAIDDYDLRASILYDGNMVWPFKRSMKEFQKYDKSGSIEKLTDFFYDFLYTGCDDIAHYDKTGYIGYYDADFTRVKREVIFASRVPGWHTDLQKILDAMRKADEKQLSGAEDDFADINPSEIRAKLAKSGIVNGQLVDPDALENDPFIRMVERDVARMADTEHPQKRIGKAHKTATSGYEQLTLFGRSA